MYNSIDELIKENKSSFYVFDIGNLKSRIKHIKNRLPENTAICYAIKANPFVVKEIENDVERFEICSHGETEICMNYGIDTTKMVISGIYKSRSFIEGLVARPDFHGIITVESINQYDMLCEFSEKYKRSLKLLLRLTNDSQFGINETDIEKIISDKKNTPYINICGIQFFSGTQKTSIKKLGRELTHLDKFLCHLKEDFGYDADELEYGPGFPVSYFASDEQNEDEFFSQFSDLLNSMTNKPLLILELGRSIAASCGKYFTHIVDIKQNCGQNYALTDGGMHHLVYYGQYMAMKQPTLSVVNKPDIIYNKKWTICGALCSMNDIITKQIELPDISVGDILCFENTGAYCMTEGISLFLSRDLPAIYLLLENGDIICARNAMETASLNTTNYERIF